ncbi:MAG: tetratricopeptide repeat protein [Rubripirellula sp.]
MRKTTCSLGRWSLLTTVAFILIVSFGSPAPAATATEMLEKGIYTEETVGDLEAAIAVYEKVVGQGKDSINAAAEAQLRIGVCYEKQGKADLAAKAFQAVIDNFPTATEFVGQAKSRLPGAAELLPVPWGDGDETQYELKLQNGMGIGTQIWRVSKSEFSGKPAWECNTWQVISLNGQKHISEVFADPKTFAPIESTWSHTLLGTATAKYGNGEVTIEMVGKSEPTTLKLDGTNYDNEQGSEVFRRLPLAVGYKTTMNVVSSLGSAKIPLGIEVAKIETIEVPAGKFECFRMQLDIGQTFWISNDAHRYVVRFEAGGASADLIRAGQLSNDEVTKLDFEGVTAAVPAGWFSYSPSNPGASKTKKMYLIDPKCVGDTRVEVGSLTSIKSAHDSPAAWMQNTLDEYKERMPGFAIGKDGIQTIKVGDRDAAVAEIEFVDGKRKMKGRRICVFGDSTAANIGYMAETDEFQSLAKPFQSIVDSMNVK